MYRVGISDFKLCSRDFFDRGGMLESVKYRISHDLDRNGIEMEFDSDFQFEDILTDLVEWAFKLGREAKDGC